MVGETAYQIQFPEELAGTIADTDLDFSDSEPLEGFRFIFYGDGQGGVGMDAEGRAGRLKLRPRAHHASMLVLARERLEAERNGVGSADSGWLPFDLTAHRLGIDPKTLNVHIHRARQELARHGVVGATSVVERRSVTREVRFGSSSVTLIDL